MAEENWDIGCRVDGKLEISWTTWEGMSDREAHSFEIALT